MILICVYFMMLNYNIILVGKISLEQFKLADNGNEIRVEIDHVLPESQALKLVKILQRIPESFVSETISFQNVSPVNNWAFPKSHAPSTLRSVQLRIVDCIEVVTAGAVARRSSLVSSDSFGPSSPLRGSAGSAASAPATHMRRYNGELSSGETVQLFVAEVTAYSSPKSLVYIASHFYRIDICWLADVDMPLSLPRIRSF